MKKKKPLDIGAMPLGPKSSPSQPNLAALFSLIVIFAAVAAGFWLFFPRQIAQQGEGSVEIYLEGPTPLLENGSAIVRAFSSCGRFELLLDGEKVAEGTSRAEAVLSPKIGQHTIQAKGGACSDSVTFSVIRRECEPTEREKCLVGGCEGEKTCIGGFFSECVLPRKICVPGERTGCTLDACRFGRMECNACGTGFLECLPDEITADTANSMVCPG
ncbi:TPA: hypothetical protein HA225_02805 [Candidatus Micrarchaeota archaeon]|nr:hypothetical protein [Candidatus Micrarchaeota archaeon]HIH30697.1 hypothetical protein [Candidatus Micrarchaeota archaeon]